MLGYTVPLLSFLYVYLGYVSCAITKVGSNVILNSTNYYTVAAVENSDALVLLTSTDFKTWTYKNGIFSYDTVPLWANSSSIQDPDLNVIGTNGVRIYFAAKDLQTDRFAVSVAFSDLIATERYYSTVNRPLVQSSRYDFVSPSLLTISSTINQYLLYLSAGENMVYSVQLSADGLAVEDVPKILLKPSLEWAQEITSTWTVAENDQYFVFYVTSSGAIGVARSNAFSGPFVERKEPIAYTSTVDLFDLKSRKVFRLDRQGWPILGF